MAPAARPSDALASRTRRRRRREALLAAAHDLLADRGPGGADRAPHRRRRRREHDERLLPLRRQGRRARRAVHRRLPPARRARWPASPSSDDPIDDLRQCGAGYRRFARENPTYYSLMFDRVVPDFEPSERAKETPLADPRPGRRRGSSGRWTPGRCGPGDPFAVAAGAVGVRARARLARGAHATGELDVFDWDTIYDITTEALVRGPA